MNGSASEVAPAVSETEHWPEILIRPAPDGWQMYAREVWQSSALIWLLLLRNIKVRYKQTVIGAAWAILQPLFSMLIFTVLFGKLMKVPTDGKPYPLFALSALTAWSYFGHALTITTKCLIDQQDLMTKVYFPRLILPLVTTLEAAIDYLISSTLLLVLLLGYGVWPSWHILALPFLLLLLMATALGAGLWLAALNLRYRDIGSVLPFALQVLFFVTPVAYASNLIPEAWRAVYALNPLMGVMEGFRWALLGTAFSAPSSLFISLLAGIGLLVSGLWFFRRREDFFVDEV